MKNSDPASVVDVLDDGIAFLSGGPSIRHLQLPAGFLRQPVLESVLAFYGHFYRSVVFYPRILDTDMVHGFTRELQQIESKAGRLNVQCFYDRANGQTFIRWPVRHGGLFTHCRDEDRMDVEYILQNVEVLDGPVHPTILTYGRVAVQGMATPGHEESITFVRLDQRGDTIEASATVRRPGWLHPSVSRTYTDSDGAVRHDRGVTQLIDISVKGVGDESETEWFADHLAARISAML